MPRRWRPPSAPDVIPECSRRRSLQSREDRDLRRSDNCKLRSHCVAGSEAAPPCDRAPSPRGRAWSPPQLTSIESARRAQGESCCERWVPSLRGRAWVLLILLFALGESSGAVGRATALLGAPTGAKVGADGAQRLRQDWRHQSKSQMDSRLRGNDERRCARGRTGRRRARADSRPARGSVSRANRGYARSRP